MENIIILFIAMFSFLGQIKNKHGHPHRRVNQSIKSVLILGNSITQHGPDKSLDWSGNWGMAASSADSDFVHILTRNIHKKNATVDVEYKNISDFERNYKTYDFKKFDSFKRADLIVFTISENVVDSLAQRDQFINYYKNLIAYIGNGSRVVVTNSFWYNKNVNILIKNFATENNIPFIQLDDLSKDKSNMALGKFKNPGVAAHPSDKGMRLIAQRIWIHIQQYF